MLLYRLTALATLVLVSAVEIGPSTKSALLVDQPDSRKEFASPNTTISPLNTSAFPDVECKRMIQSKYAWARWVIIGSVILTLFLLSLPLFFTSCLGPKGRSLLIGCLLILSICWVVFALLADSLIYDTFSSVAKSSICNNPSLPTETLTT